MLLERSSMRKGGRIERVVMQCLLVLASIPISVVAFYIVMTKSPLHLVFDALEPAGPGSVYVQGTYVALFLSEVASGQSRYIRRQMLTFSSTMTSFCSSNRWRLFRILVSIRLDASHSKLDGLRVLLLFLWLSR
jgi:hypothetical protein